MELCYEHLRANKPNNQKEMDKFLKRHSQNWFKKKETI